MDATFAAGCFWGVQSEFDAVEGVTATEVGYTGGKTKNPTYEQVCGKATGHAEAVKVSYDPEVVSYETLVRHFFKIHDPTQLNRQGPDVGDQYRSAIFTHDEAQAQTANQVMESLQDPDVVTQIEAAGAWWPAEEYHQKYFEKRGIDGCRI